MSMTGLPRIACLYDEPTPAGRATPPLVCSRAMLEPGAMPAPLRPEAASDDRYRVTNSGDADQRDVVFGGQFLAQAIVASSLRHPGKDVRSIQAVFARPGRIDAHTELAVEPMHDGRTFASDTVTAWQGDRLCARFMIVLDADEPDVIRHDVTMPRVAGPNAATPTGPSGLVYPGSDIRIVDDVDLWDTDAPVGPAESFLWTRAVRSPTIPRCTAPCSRGPPTVS